MLSFFPRGVLDEILNLIESASECFPSYSCISGLTWEQGWLGSLCASSQYDQTLLLFFAHHLRWMYIPKTHTGLQKIQKNIQQPHVV